MLKFHKQNTNCGPYPPYNKRQNKEEQVFHRLLKILCETHHVKKRKLTLNFQNSLLESSILAVLCLHATCYLAFLAVRQVS